MSLVFAMLRKQGHTSVRRWRCGGGGGERGVSDGGGGEGELVMVVVLQGSCGNVETGGSRAALLQFTKAHTKPHDCHG